MRRIKPSFLAFLLPALLGYGLAYAVVDPVGKVGNTFPQATRVLTSLLSGTVAKANGGFAQDVSTGLTNNQVAYVSGGAITIGALPDAALSANVMTLDGTQTVTGTKTWNASQTTTDNTYAWGDATHRLTGLGTVGLLSGANTLQVTTALANSSTPIAFDINNTVTFSTSGNRLFRVRNNGTERFSVSGSAINTNGDIIPLGIDGADSIGAVNKRYHIIYVPQVYSGNVQLLMTSDLAETSTTGAVGIGTGAVTYSSNGRLVEFVNFGVVKGGIYNDGSFIGPKAGTAHTALHAFPSGTGSLCSTDNISTCVTGAALPFTTLSGGATGTLGAATVYLTGPGVAGSASEVYLGMGTRTAVAQNLYCQLGTAPGGSDTVVYTARVAGSDSTLTCTITGAAVTCNDTTHRPSVAAGNKLSIKAVSSAGTAAAATCTFEETFS